MRIPNRRFGNVRGRGKQPFPKRRPGNSRERTGFLELTLSITQHITQVLRTMQQPAQMDFAAFVAIEDQVVVKARHQEVARGVLGIAEPPDRPHCGMGGEQLNRGVPRRP